MNKLNDIDTKPAISNSLFTKKNLIESGKSFIILS